MANIFSRIRDSFRRATSSNVAAADRNRDRGRDNPRTATGRVAQNLLSDIAISFGNTAGVSQAGIDDYNRRTEQSRQAMKDLQERNQRDSGSSTPPPAPAAPTVETVAEPVTATPEPPAAPPAEPVKLEPVGGSTTTAGSAEEEADILEAGATGDAEKKVGDTIRTRGRRRNIATSAQGLLSQAPTRRRRSLMGGGLLR